MNLASRVRTARVAADLTIAELAEESGVSVRSIGNIERGVTTSPQRATLEAIAVALHLHDDDRRALFDIVEPHRKSPVSDFRRGESRGGVVPQRFIARDSERARLHRVLHGAETSAAVVVFGPAGIGKSALVSSVLSEQGDARVVVDVALAGTKTPTSLSTMKAVLAASSVEHGAELDRFEQAASAWRSFSADHHPVLVLDGVQDEAPVRLLLSLGGYSTLIVTSRLPLAGISGIDRLAVPPLSQDDAVRFLRDRIPSLRGAEVEEVAQLCDHLPLALDLISLRLERSSRDTARRVLRALRSPSHRLNALRFGGRSVKGALQPSYDALAADSARLFGVLSIHAAATFVVDDAAEIAGIERPDAEDELDALVDVGLLEALPGGRFRMPQLVRLFGVDRIPISRSREAGRGSTQMGSLAKSTDRLTGASR